MIRKFFFLLIIICPLLLTAQSDESLSFLEVGAGMGPTLFRDQATSPLVYDGLGFTGTGAWIKTNAKRERVLGACFTAGELTAEVGERYEGESNFYSFSAYFTQLYQLKRWSNESWNVKVGGTLMLTGNLRTNYGLQNNSTGLEGFGNLLGSFKISRDVSRTKIKEGKIWFMDYTLKPRRRFLSYQLDIGVWNNSLRNGYIYIDQSALLNESEDVGSYVFKTFSGLRFHSVLSYTIFLPKSGNNAIRFAYEWDALRTGGELDRFEMAAHVIRFSLLFNLK